MREHVRYGFGEISRHIGALGASEWRERRQPPVKRTKTAREVFVKTTTILLFALVLTQPLSAQWPQFRGPEGTGHVGEHRPAADVGRGQERPMEDGDSRPRLVVAGHPRQPGLDDDGDAQMAASCSRSRVDRDSGKIVFDLKLFDVATPQYAHPFNTYASPTPVIEPGRVYVTFGSPGTAAIDTKTGKVIWERRDFECNHFRGAGSSPILFGDLLLMHFDGSDHQFVVALDKRTGKTVWRTPRSIDFQDLGPDGKPKADGDFRKGFATPQIVMVERPAGDGEQSDRRRSTATTR